MTNLTTSEATHVDASTLPVLNHLDFLCRIVVSSEAAGGAFSLVEAGSLIHLPPRREHAFRIASETAHFYNLVTPGGFEAFIRATSTPAAQPFDGELPLPGPMPPGAVGRLQEVLTPLGCTITGPPPFGRGEDH